MSEKKWDETDKYLIKSTVEEENESEGVETDERSVQGVGGR